MFSLGTRSSWRVVSREDKALVDSVGVVKFRAMWTLLLSYRREGKKEKEDEQVENEGES